jgi:hypothetical protein
MFKKCGKSKYFEDEINKPKKSYEEIKSILKSGQACDQPTQNLLFLPFPIQKSKD